VSLFDEPRLCYLWGFTLLNFFKRDEARDLFGEVAVKGWGTAELSSI